MRTVPSSPRPASHAAPHHEPSPLLSPPAPITCKGVPLKLQHRLHCWQRKHTVTASTCKIPAAAAPAAAGQLSCLYWMLLEVSSSQTKPSHEMHMQNGHPQVQCVRQPDMCISTQSCSAAPVKQWINKPLYIRCRGVSDVDCKSLYLHLPAPPWRCCNGYIGYMGTGLMASGRWCWMVARSGQTQHTC